MYKIEKTKLVQEIFYILKRPNTNKTRILLVTKLTVAAWTYIYVHKP